MKTMLASAPQSSGYPLKIVEPKEKDRESPISPPEGNATAIPSGKNANVTDAPESWDESWFANYE